MNPDATLKRALDALCNTPGPSCTVEDLEAAREALADLADWIERIDQIARHVEDLEAAREALADLADWIERGGFLPRWPVDGPTIEDVIAATADSARLVAQVTRVCWAIDAIDGDVSASRDRVRLAVNALLFTCANVAETIARAEEIAAEREAR